MKRRTVFLAVIFCLLLACARGPEATPGPTDIYTFSGEVLSLNPEKKIAKIKHGPIADAAGKVWMEAMTMEFPIKDAKQFAMLRPGLKVKAKLFQRPADFEYWVGDIETVP